MSGTLGVLMAIPYLFWLGGLAWLHLRRGNGSWKTGLVYVGMVLIVAAIVCAPLVGLSLDPRSCGTAVNAESSWTQRLNNLAIIVALSLGWLGKSFLLPSLIVLVGLSLATAVGLTVVIRTRPEERYRASALLAFLGGVVAVLASLGYGRAFVTGEALWATTRVCCAFGSAAGGGFFRQSVPSPAQCKHQGFLCGLAGVVFVGNVFGAGGYLYARKPLVQVRADEDALIRSILSGKSLEQAARDFFPHENGYSVELGAEWLAMLRDQQLGLFGLSARQQRDLLGWWRPDVKTPLALRRADADRFLGEGWSVHGNADGRWTNDGQAVIRFQVDPDRPHQLTVRMLPFVVPGKLDGQRVSLRLNGHELTTLVLQRWDWQNVAVSLPVAWLRSHNTLEWLLPDTVAPKAIGYNGDPEPHGVLVQSIDIH